MDRIAIISDIHSNLEALKAVLNDIENRGIKDIYCLGDIIAKGVHAHECIALIKEKCSVVIQGNCDLYFSMEHDLSKIEGINKQRILWNKSLLDQDDRNYLLSLNPCYEFYMSGSLIRLFHASPNKNDDSVFTLHPLEKKFTQFLPGSLTCSQKTADIILYGHTHTASIEHLYHRTLINVGSVGNPIEIIQDEQKNALAQATTSAQYFILEGELNAKEYSSISFQFVKVPYDIDKELATSIDNIEKEAYTKELKKGLYRDLHKRSIKDL